MRPYAFPSRHRHAVASLALLAASGLASACEGSAITLRGRTTVTVSPVQVRLPVGDTVRIRVTANGRPCDCAWVVEGARAEVDATGLVRALTPGSALVIATVRRDPNAKASAFIEVVAP